MIGGEEIYLNPERFDDENCGEKVNIIKQIIEKVVF